MINKFKFNDRTRSFGTFMDVMTRLLSYKHLVIVLVDLQNKCLIEIHKGSFIGFRLSDIARKMNQALGLKFTIQHQFDISDEKSAEYKRYMEFKSQMYELFASD